MRAIFSKLQSEHLPSHLNQSVASAGKEAELQPVGPDVAAGTESVCQRGAALGQSHHNWCRWSATKEPKRFWTHPPLWFIIIHQSEASCCHTDALQLDWQEQNLIFYAFKFNLEPSDMCVYMEKQPAGICCLLLWAAFTPNAARLHRKVNGKTWRLAALSASSLVVRLCWTFPVKIGRHCRTTSPQDRIETIELFKRHRVSPYTRTCWRIIGN